jgi:hypothetical protein
MELETLEQRPHDMADDNREIAMTGNTRSMIEEAEKLGLVKAVSGKFKMIEPGCLNSIYRIV